MLAPYVVQNMLDQLVPRGFHAYAFEIDRDGFPAHETDKEGEVAVRVWAHETGPKVATASFVVDRPICANGTPIELANHLKEQLCLVLERITDGRELLLDLELERIEMDKFTVFSGVGEKGEFQHRQAFLPVRCNEGGKFVPAVTGSGCY